MRNISSTGANSRALLLLSIVAHIEQVARTDIGGGGPIRVTDCVYDRNGLKNCRKVS
ncbi:MAG: hypothetical protein QP890_09600 [Corynebacterium amycolatum]|uniref:hypothetical protein n=1 Tax=Corynebacterium sp. LK22 TaxID=2044584 RepID=UPI00034E9C79|nr:MULTISPECIES: hypothetical protein [Corynebacterium]EPD47751.1 hypothetical protein HMPREF1206_01059 [Corynebacterium sp. HFH0082]MDK8507675.1 hypothetical protein [Corynebacterium amycolatum]